MLSDNIRKYRKLNNMSQDELAEKLEVTRQSISLWETGQTQPSLENVVALAKLFHVSTDELLTDGKSEPAVSSAVAVPKQEPSQKKTKIFLTLCLALIVVSVIVALLWRGGKGGAGNGVDTDINAQTTTANTESEAVSGDTENVDTDDAQTAADTETEAVPRDTENADTDDTQTTAADTELVTVPRDTENADTDGAQTTAADTELVTVPRDTENADTDGAQTTTADAVEVIVPMDTEKDIYGYLKNFVIQNGTINGDYCYYSKSSDHYGGYASEQFSLYYWGDTDKIEFCLHSVIDETFSINFYLYVPQKHSGSYEYISSYYYRDTGVSLYEARGTIDAGEFTDNYPLNCTKYIGSTDEQNVFMEISRQGICDLIDCLREFIEVEGIEYSFEEFGFFKF